MHKRERLRLRLLFESLLLLERIKREDQMLAGLEMVGLIVRAATMTRPLDRRVNSYCVFLISRSMNLVRSFECVAGLEFEYLFFGLLRPARQCKVPDFLGRQVFLFGHCFRLGESLPSLSVGDVKTRRDNVFTSGIRIGARTLRLDSLVLERDPYGVISVIPVNRVGVRAVVTILLFEGVVTEHKKVFAPREDDIGLSDARSY